MQTFMFPPGCTAHQTGAVSLLRSDSAQWHAWLPSTHPAPRTQHRRLSASSTAERRGSRREVACSADAQQLTRSFDDVSYDDLADSIGVPSRSTRPTKHSGLSTTFRASLPAAHAKHPFNSSVDWHSRSKGARTAFRICPACNAHKLSLCASNPVRQDKRTHMGAGGG
jgi:hypothetical protein